MAKINARVEALENQILQLVRKLEDIERSNPSSHGRNESGNPNSIPIQKPTEISPNSNDRGTIALEFPRFSGANPTIWLGKCRRYFLLCRTPENEKVILASMYMENKAEPFYTNYVEGRDGIGWERFSEMVLERFGDPKGIGGSFKNLKQEGSVEMYVEKFEELKASMDPRNTTLKEEYVVTCFLNGLKEEIGNLFKARPPGTLTRAIQLAKMHEMALEHLVEFVSEDEDEDEDDEVEGRARFHSFAVGNTPNPSIVEGMATNEPISIILVSGSTHSFLDPKAAKRLGCKLEQTKRFLVNMINGREVECNSKCCGFKWQMGGVNFTADVRIMELEWYGCDLVLGVDFLKKTQGVGFSDRGVFIMYQGRKMELQ